VGERCQNKIDFCEDVKKKYEALQKKKLTAQELIESLEKDTKAVESEVMNLVTEAVNSTPRLQEIALLPTPFNWNDYIDILIKNEEADRKPGYEGRIRFLQRLRDQAEILSKIESGVRLADMNLSWTHGNSTMTLCRLYRFLCGTFYILIDCNPEKQMKSKLTSISFESRLLHSFNLTAI